MKKRIISVILVISMFTALFAGLGITASAVGYGSEGLTYEPLFDTGAITSAHAYFDDSVSFSQAAYELAANYWESMRLPSLRPFSQGNSTEFMWYSFVGSYFSSVGYGQQLMGAMDQIIHKMNFVFRDLMNKENFGFGRPIREVIFPASDSSFGISMKEATATVGGKVQSIMRPYLNVNSRSGFYIVDQYGGYPYYIVSSPSAPSQQITYAYYNRNIVDSMTNAAYEVSIDDLALYQNVYGSSHGASYFTEGDYTYSGYKANGSQLVLCAYDGANRYAVYTKYKNQNTPSAPEGVVDLGFNPIINGNYSLESLNLGSKFKFNYVNQYEFQSAANNPYTSVVQLNVTGTDGTVYPLSALVYGSVTGEYSINLKTGSSNIPADLIWYHKLSANASKLFAVGNQQLGIPYQYGGVSPSQGFDCSGLVKYVYRTSGVYNFPDYNANQIYNLCTPISAAEAMPGDLVAFTNTGDPAYAEKTHIGIYAGAGMMLVAPRTGDVVKYQPVSELAARNPSYCRVPTSDLVSRNLVVLKRGGDFATDDPYNYYTENDGNDFNFGLTSNNMFIDELNQTVVNISGGDGFSQVGGNAITLYLDDLIYDEATKSYTTSSHTAYLLNGGGNNYINVNYNYEYNFYIDYTSVTYIGTTADANETYNFYYELPDGRNSSDMSPDDLLPLDIQIDVLAYKRSTDDTRLRSLYHFNGNTLDSSYWNYETDFIWDTGASITYVDAGTNFQGALYLDELDHEFKITLPSAIGSGDFTLEFRYYQSYTAAPQSDSYVSSGTNQLWTFDGAKFGSGLSGIKFADTPVGSWVALCVQRLSGTVYYYVNGVMAHAVTNFNTVLGDEFTFHFGKNQQTYKQIDELRVLNFSNYPASGYTPSTIQFDTNLSLVLPTDSVPIADEYWDITTEGTNLLSQYNLDWWDAEHSSSGVRSSYFSSVATGSTTTSGLQLRWLGSIYNDSIRVNTTPQSFPYMHTWSNLVNYSVYEGTIFLPVSYSRPALLTPVGNYSVDGMTLTFNKQGTNYFNPGTYTFSMVGIDGTVNSFTFDYTGTLGSDSYTNISNALASADMNGYRVVLYDSIYYGATYQNWRNIALAVIPTSSAKEFLYLSLEQGSQSTVHAEHVTGIVGIPEDQLNTPTLAVRTDQKITSWSIGGVRPSVPQPGMVWALVENDIITSLQIYDGYGWTEVDGRIWTGERFVPLGSYNIVTLNDLLDIIGSMPGMSPIYSQTAFWRWLQEAWQGMIDLLTEIRDALSGGISGTGNNDFPIEDEEDGEGFGDYNGGLFKVVWRFMKGITNVVFDGIGGLIGAANNLDGSLTVLDPNAEISIFNVSDEIIY